MGFHPPTATARKERPISTAGSTHFPGRRTDRAMVYTCLLYTSVAVGVDQGRILYKETIAAPVEGVGHYEPLRHYAEVHLLLEPLPQGSGLVLATRCSEDVLAGHWQRLILTHLAERTHRGVLTGAPITDLKITLMSEMCIRDRKSSWRSTPTPLPTPTSTSSWPPSGTPWSSRG